MYLLRSWVSTSAKFTARSLCKKYIYRRNYVSSVAARAKRLSSTHWEIRQLMARFYLYGIDECEMAMNNSACARERDVEVAGLRKAKPWLRGPQLAAAYRSTRPLSSLVAGALSASVVIGGSGHITLEGLAAGVAMTILTMFGFVVNDIFDRQKDAAAAVQRPIATGELSVQMAIVLAIGLLLPVFLVSTFIGTGAGVLLATCLALLAYSPFAHLYPLGKGPYVAALACAPLIYGSAVAGVRVLAFSYATLACFVLGREMLMDSEEVVGDRRAGLETIAVVLGCKRARKIGTTLMFVSAICVVAIARGEMDRVAAVCALISLMWVFLWPDLSDARRIQLSRFPMLLGAVAIAIAG